MNNFSVKKIRKSTVGLYAIVCKFTRLFTIIAIAFTFTACGGAGSGGGGGGGTGDDATAPVITLSGTTPVDVEVGSVYTDAGATASDNVDGDITASIVTVNPVNTAVAGTYAVTYDVTDAAGNSATQVTRTVNVVAAGTVDTTAPVISLIGTTPIDVEIGSVYTDAGATASDNVDGDITASIVTVNPVNTAIAGAYTVTYDVDDSAGNSAVQATRTVNVVAAGTVDTTPPVITLSGTTPVDVEVGSVYTDAGATASDNVDGDITASIVTVNPVNTALLGTYTVTYDVDDAAGNSATQVTRTVNVVDTAAPVITLSGTTPVGVEVGSVYTDAGATASDNVDGDVTASIVTVNPVNIAVVGTYLITYDVTDAAGNSAMQVTRTVNVIDTTAPVITLSGTTPVDVEVGSVYTDAGATASDNVDGDITASIVTVNPVNTAVVGTYAVTYDVIDTAGNSATQVTRTVNVVDTTAPVISLIGTTPVDVEVGSVYTDAGATASDDVDGDITASIVTVNPVNTAVVGTYAVTYDVTDAAGNSATQVTRTVNVIDTTAPTFSSTFPVDLATDVTLNPSISITFSEAMDTSTFTGNFKLADGGAVPGTISFTRGDTVAVFTPTAKLTNDTTYTATVTTGARDPSGNAFAGTSWSFTTIALPVLGAFYPANGANWNDYVKNDGADIYSATDAAADGTETGGYSAVIHGGEMRSVEVYGFGVCDDLVASDELGVFDWTCDASTNPVKMVSTGLKSGKFLSDLLDFGAPGWLSNSVTVTGTGSELLFTTTSAVWWGNLVEVANSDGSLTTPGTVYMVTANPSLVYTMDASKVALVIQPDVTMSGPGLFNTLVSANSQNFLWVEGAIDSTGDSGALYWSSVKFSVLRNLNASNAATHSIRLDNSSNNSLSNIISSNNGGVGVFLLSSSNNSLSNITVGNDSYGVWVSNSLDNSLSNITASNNNYGIYFSTSSNNSLSNVTASNNTSSGVYLQNSSKSSLLNVTVANNNAGIRFDNSSNSMLSNVTANNSEGAGVTLGSSLSNSLSNITVANNGTYGVYLSDFSNKNSLSNIAAANNNYGIYFSNSSENNFTGLLKVGNNASSDCYVIGGLFSGLDNISCANNGASDAALTNGVTLASSFVAKVTTDDTVNSSDTSGSAASYPTDPAAFDITSFENIYRGWGLDGSAFPNANHQGQWTTGVGRIWDWSLSTLDSGIIRNAVTALPTGDDTITHIWSDALEVTFLRNAVEVTGDDIGNDNGLCESGETCLFTPNIGSYQGHGTLQSAGAFTDGVLTGITLMRYPTNGY